MRYETMQFILANKNRFRYNDMAGTGNDASTDPGASAIDPNNFLAPVIGGSKIMQVLAIVALVLVIIYLSKNIFANGLPAIK